MVTVTKYVTPEVMAGVVAVMVVEFSTVTFVALRMTLVLRFELTKLTVAPLTNPVPTMVNTVPPDADPVPGERL